MSAPDIATDLALPDPESLEQYADPGEFVVAACERGKAWLAEALEHGDLDALANAKGYAETLRVATVQKQLGKDAELSAQELVRRAERCIGLGIRKGQEAGRVVKAGDIGGGGRGGQKAAESRTSSYQHLDRPTDFATSHELWANGTGIYALTDDVSDDDFEQAVEEAKAERNLSRANVVRKARGEPSQSSTGERVARARQMASEGYTSRQIGQVIGVKNMGPFCDRHGIEVPADEVVGKQRAIDPARIVAGVAESLSAEVDSIDSLGLGDPRDFNLDPAEVEGWVTSLSSSLQFLNRFHKRLKEMTRG